MMLGEQQLLRRAEAFVDRAQLFQQQSFWNSFSLSHTGMAMRNDLKPRGAKAR